MDKKLELINYTTLEPVLLRIHQNNVNPSEKIARKFQNEFNEFMQNFKSLLMKNDPVIKQYVKIENKAGLMKKLRSRIGYYYNAFEYEIHVKLPKTTYQITTCDKAGCVAIKLLVDTLKGGAALEVMKSWTDSRGYILPYGFKTWSEGIMRECFGSDRKVGKFHVSIDRSPSGRFVFNVKTSDPQVIFDVEVGFVLSFDNCSAAIFRNHDVDETEEWIAVPVLSKLKLNPKEINWRYSFPLAEKRVLLDLNYLKCVYRLMKIFREAAELNHLTNYHIKNLFMLQTDTEDDSFWKKGLSYLFMVMICRLQVAIENKSLPFYWNQKANLLSDLSDEELSECRTKLDDFIKKIISSFTVKQQVQLEDFFVNKMDDDDILSQSMMNMSMKK